MGVGQVKLFCCQTLLALALGGLIAGGLTSAKTPAPPLEVQSYPFPGGRVAIIWHEAVYGHTLDIYAGEKLVYGYEASPAGAIFHAEPSRLLKSPNGKGLYFVAVWNNGVRSQTLVVHDLKKNGEIVLEQNSAEEVLYRLQEDVLIVSYVVAQHRKQGPPQMVVRDRKFQLK